MKESLGRLLGTKAQIAQLTELARRARKVIALTGAGISVDSGIPAFRGNQGLWEKYDPMEYAQIEAFLRDPGKVWAMLAEMDLAVRDAKPNAAHYALAHLEQVSRFSSVITQNVDNLHQRAGSRHVIEFHGNTQRLKCLSCNRLYGKDQVSLAVLPPRCSCGGVLKPDAVFFGEAIPWEASLEASHEAESCDLILVVGTSAVVAPASSIPIMAKRNGATVVEINLEPTTLTDTVADLSIMRSATEVLPELVDELRRLSS
jgi:NAD-dependent deacetylase